MSAQHIDINEFQEFLLNNKMEEHKSGEFDFSNVWETIDTSALTMCEQTDTNIDPTQLSAFMGDMTPALRGIEESPMMNTPYLDSCLNTPFTPATVFTPSLNQFQNSPYYSPYIESSNHLYNQFTAIDPQDIQVAKYLKNDLSLNEPLASSSQATANSLFGSIHCEPSQLLLNADTNNSDSLFPPLPSDMPNTMSDNNVQQDFFNLEDDLFEIDESLFNLLEEQKQPPCTKKRKSNDKELKTNKRIKIDDSQKHKCHICSATFNRRYNLGTHIKTHDKNRKKDFSCYLCTKTFDRKHDLTRHVSTVHNGERAFTCSECVSTFSRKDAMVRHKVQKHGYQA